MSDLLYVLLFFAQTVLSFIAGYRAGEVAYIGRRNGDKDDEG
jgi:hypothetical protein